MMKCRRTDGNLASGTQRSEQCPSRRLASQGLRLAPSGDETYEEINGIVAKLPSGHAVCRTGCRQVRYRTTEANPLIGSSR
jgi:hypothetical protein